MDTDNLRHGRLGSPRLLTPEDSRGSNASQGSESPGDGVQRVSSAHGQIVRSMGNINASSYMPGKKYDFHEIVGNRHSRNHSPPYTASDQIRPSLPPLKSVLGAEMASPPRTPCLQETPFQPSPREPLFTPAYKPAALYPNKKARTGLSIDIEPRRPSVTTFDTPGLPASAFDNHSASRWDDANAMWASTTPDFSKGPRRMSLPQHSKTKQLRSPPGSSAYTRQDFPGVATIPSRAATDSFSNRFSNPHSAPHTSLPRLVDSFQSDYFHSRRLSGQVGTSQCYMRSARTSPDHSSPESRYPTSTERSFQQGEVRRHGQTEQSIESATAGFAPSSYGDERAPFFMPNHFEYHHGKPRKRSNLPKQSTEIMKTWFDQNIHNPYPSEEQKAYFSSATGISMTQVSNWFINHRRRCPELRDKRDRVRSADTDLDL